MDTHTLKRRAIVVAITMLAATDAAAAPGDLDPTFGNSGRVLLEPVQGRAVEVHDMIASNDGKLVVVGTSKIGGSKILMLVRFTGDGTPDPSFGNGGFVEGWLSNDRGAAVIQTSSGDLVVAGSTDADFGLWRFDANGVADPGFGTGGLTSLDFGGNEHAIAVTEQSDGKLVIVGAAGIDTDNDGGADDTDIVLARFTEDGLLDASFGIEGIARLPSPEPETWEVAAGMDVDADGNLVVAGNRYGGTYHGELVIARLTPDGDFDAGFDGDGVRELLLVDDEDRFAVAYGLTVDGQGRIVVGGGVGYLWWTFLLFSDAYLARLLADGSLDKSFGDSGVALTARTGWAFFKALLVEPDGSIVAGGVEYVEEPAGSAESNESVFVGPYATLSRFHEDAVPDAASGVGGTTVVDFGNGSQASAANVASLIRQGDGRLVLAGHQQNLLALAAFSPTDAGFAGYVGFTRSNRKETRSAASTTIQIKRSGGSTGAISVAYETTDDTARAGHDFIQQSGRLEWADGDDAVRTITVPLTADTEQYNDRRFGVRLFDVDGGAVLAASESTVTIGEYVMPTDTGNPPPPSSGSGGRITDGGGNGGLGWLTLLLLGFLVVRHELTTRAHRQ